MCFCSILLLCFAFEIKMHRLMYLVIIIMQRQMQPFWSRAAVRQVFILFMCILWLMCFRSIIRTYCSVFEMHRLMCLVIIIMQRQMQPFWSRAAVRQVFFIDFVCLNQSSTSNTKHLTLAKLLCQKNTNP